MCKMEISSLSKYNAYDSEWQVVPTSIHSTSKGTMTSQLVKGVRTDLGTDFGPYPVHCRSTRCRSVFVDRHRSNSTRDQCWQHVSFDADHCYQREWLFYVLNLFSALMHHSHQCRIELPSNCRCSTWKHGKACFIAIHHSWTTYWLSWSRRHCWIALVQFFVDCSNTENIVNTATYFCWSQNFTRRQFSRQLLQRVQQYGGILIRNTQEFIQLGNIFDDYHTLLIHRHVMF